MLDSDTNRQTVKIRSANNYILLVAFVRPAEVLMDVWGHMSPVPPLDPPAALVTPSVTAACRNKSEQRSTKTASSTFVVRN